MTYDYYGRVWKWLLWGFWLVMGATYWVDYAFNMSLGAFEPWMYAQSNLKQPPASMLQRVSLMSEQDAQIWLRLPLFCISLAVLFYLIKKINSNNPELQSYVR